MCKNFVKQPVLNLTCKILHFSVIEKSNVMESSKLVNKVTARLIAPIKQGRFPENWMFLK